MESAMNVNNVRASRRRVFRLAGAALAAAAFAGASGASYAETFPSKPIRLVVPYPPGGPSDITARTVAAGLTDVLGQPVVVENRPGAGAVVGSQVVLNSQPDGHTLLMASNVTATGKWLYKNLPFDPMKDFKAVAGLVKSPHLVVVHPSFPGEGIQDLIKQIKASGGDYNYASSGTGTMPHLGSELFKSATGTDMTPIPYRGSGPAITAVLSQEVPVYFDIMFSAQAIVSSGKLKTLGVTSLERVPQFPDVPTLHEQGLENFELYSWFGIVVPTGVPDAAVARLNKAINTVLDRPDVKERLTAMGALTLRGNPEQFKAMIDSDYEMWGGIIQKANITLD
jgi:tripartite-type tricarboxylate transporter receptor subunit TctC